jgi:hypothetical protein
MGFGPYSQIVTPAAYVPEIDPNILLKGAETTQAYQERAFKELSDSENALFGINANGPDKQALSQIRENFNNDMKNLTYGDLSSPQTMSKVRGLIKQYSSNPDLIGISQRTHTFQNMEEERKTALKEGKPYFNTGYNEAIKYFSGSDYLKDKTFSNNGFIGINMAKERADSLKDVPKISKWVTVGGYKKEIKSYDPEALDEALNAFYSDPRIERQMKYEFDEKYNNYDWETEGVSRLDAYKSNAQNIVDKAYQLMKTAPPNSEEYQNAKLAYERYQNEVSNYDKMISDPKSYAQSMKNITFYNELSERKKLDALNSQFSSEEQIKVDEYTLESVKLDSDIIKEKYKQFLPGLVAYNLSQSEASAILNKGEIIKKGQLITMNDVGKASIEYAAKQQYEKSLQAAKAKQKVKTETLGQLGDNTISPSQDITIGGLKLTKSEWSETTKKFNDPKAIYALADYHAITAIAKEYPEYFGLNEQIVSDPNFIIKIEDEKPYTISPFWHIHEEFDNGKLINFTSKINETASIRQKSEESQKEIKPVIKNMNVDADSLKITKFFPSK